MRPRFKHLIILVLGSMVAYNCKKAGIPNPGTNPPPGSGGIYTLPNTGQAVVTDVGTPTSGPVTKTIGSAGGTIISDDGKVELVIPAGALASNTDISMQPVTNEAPGGIGTSYDFLPNGLKFSVPGKLTFHYTDDDLNGGDPRFLYLAYQDSLNTWVADPNKQVTDSIAKTVSLDIGHFTIYSEGQDGFHMYSLPKLVTEGKKAAVVITEILETNDEGRIIQEGGVPPEFFTDWQVNGNPGGSATDGTIAGAGTFSSYYAPAVIPKRRTVNVSVLCKVNLTRVVNGHAISTPNGFRKGINITIVPAETNYSVLIDYKDPSLIGINKQQIYADKVSFDMKVKVDAAGENFVVDAATNIVNSPPTVTPAVQTYDNGNGTAATIAWIADPYGMLDLESVKGLEGADDPMLTLYMKHTHATTPGYVLTSGTKKITIDPKQYASGGGLLGHLDVDLRKTDQVIRLDSVGAITLTLSLKQ